MPTALVRTGSRMRTAVTSSPLPHRQRPSQLRDKRRPIAHAPYRSRAASSIVGSRAAITFQPFETSAACRLTVADKIFFSANTHGTVPFLLKNKKPDLRQVPLNPPFLFCPYADIRSTLPDAKDLVISTRSLQRLTIMLEICRICRHGNSSIRPCQASVCVHHIWHSDGLLFSIIARKGAFCPRAWWGRSPLYQRSQSINTRLNAGTSSRRSGFW
jgi:hypothetical protein